MAPYRKVFRALTRNPYAKTAAKMAVGYGATRMRGPVKASRPRAQNTEPLTGQYDYKTDYRKRRLSQRVRRKVKRRKRWNRRVVNVVRNANVGSTHIIRRSLCNLPTISQTTDSVSFGMYGLNGETGDTFNPTADIREIFREIDETAWLNALNPLVSTPLHKIYSMHATMELTARNTGENDALLEVYFIRGTRRTPPLSNPVGIYSDGFNKSQLAADPNTGNTFDSELTFDTVGTTPFQSPLYCQHYRIYKRQKFRLVAGSEINLVIHDNKPRVFRMDSAITASTDRSYHGVLIQQQGAPIGGGDPTFAVDTAVTYLSVRRYRIKMFRDNLPKTALDISGV